MLSAEESNCTGWRPFHDGRAIPKSVPTPLTDELAADRIKQNQWTAFRNRSGLADAPPDLHDVIQDLRVFLLEPPHAAARGKTLSKSWMRGGPWI
jgi:hypothetical protein